MTMVFDSEMNEIDIKCLMKVINKFEVYEIKMVTNCSRKSPIN